MEENQLDNKKPKNHKKITGLVVLIIGAVALVAGGIFLLMNLLRAPLIRDAEYLVQVGEWQLENDSSVVWNFEEIGEGSLTTNFHINDYEFIWAIDGDTLKIETEWLYTLNNDYTYKLDQGKNILTLTSGEDTYTFVPAVYEDDTTEEEGEASEEESPAEAE